MMPRKRMPLIGSSGSRTGPPPFNSTALHQPRLTNRKKPNRQPQTLSSSQHHPGPSSILLSDNVTPWGGLAHSESSFTITPPAITPTRPPSNPPGPQLTVADPHEEEEENDECSCSGFSSEISSPCLLVPRKNTGGVGRRLQARSRVVPQCQVPRLPRLPPLNPITELSFSRSFTFSFFELPLHHSPHCRAERARNLFQLLKQIHY
ncbi:uncharacterized protein LOC106947416 [Poecilia latipinna]|uniref:uncharacterized protein LOC106947416 n=1 Tax=Poecilia latipinna TaxID=48699 RepID=UPI00072E89E1|nr:PREDICTED: uncharacterized protein LOC106947416 [Poecilia latipinna]